MDKITESLKKYLDSAGISHQTSFKSDGGLNMGYPTSTCFHREDLPQRMSIVVDIFPKENQFYITSSPMVVVSDRNIDKLRDFESKWNRSGMMTTLATKEEDGVLELDVYCFTLNLCGFCDNNGLEEMIWRKYLERVENETWEAWEKVSEIVGGFFYEESDGPIATQGTGQLTGLGSWGGLIKRLSELKKN